MLQANKVIASTAIEVMLRPEVIDQAKAELKERLAGANYICPTPPEIKHVVSR